MNLSIGTTFPTTWKRTKLQYAGFAAAIALAASVAVAAWPGGGSPSATTGNPARPAAASSVPQPETVFYIVGSQAEADTLEAAIAASGQEAAGATSEMRVIVADPADEASRLQLSVLFAEQANGVLQNTQAIDLRQQ